jgi:hypothetical protein
MKPATASIKFSPLKNLMAKDTIIEEDSLYRKEGSDKKSSILKLITRCIWPESVSLFLQYAVEAFINYGFNFFFLVLTGAITFLSEELFPQPDGYTNGIVRQLW